MNINFELARFCAIYLLPFVIAVVIVFRKDAKPVNISELELVWEDIHAVEQVPFRPSASHIRTVTNANVLIRIARKNKDTNEVERLLSIRHNIKEWGWM